VEYLFFVPPLPGDFDGISDGKMGGMLIPFFFFGFSSSDEHVEGILFVELSVSTVQTVRGPIECKKKDGNSPRYELCWYWNSPFAQTYKAATGSGACTAGGGF
jgi:hypothetical protein